jgi:hypothetical protein
VDLLKWVQTILHERNINHYGISADLVIVPAGKTVEFQQQNNLYFLANAFSSSSGPINGEIIGADEALPLKPHILQTVCYKHQYFTGRVNVTNNDDTQTLYVEFLIATPKKG